MNAEAQRSETDPAAAPEQAADREPGVFASMRSNQNIEQWLDYLPQDCVESMIGMGWNFST